MEELLTLSYNFGEPIDVLINGHNVTGIVEDLDEQQVKLSGEWYQLRDVTYNVH
ncbi:hypothetical protein [Cohnella lupini]|uniref:Uncharacterized protein n=1 Tax=Cohnella lupini TaxID=1294267 RepID=A0A3D9I0Y8_9BACL|nr:hypothetical protein [Cohnella lupini]RED54816.1 hypothetical protein DFP95_12172 [Cohnella lupini]